MNIALGFDKNFSKYAAVTIKSIINNNKSPITFYLMIDKSISLFDKLYIKYLISTSGNVIKYIDMSKHFANSFTGGWSKAMYYPILLDSICNRERILFLDADTLVTGDLQNFYNSDFEDNYCIAVNDYGMKSWIKSKHKILLSNNNETTIDKYFSDIRKWNDLDMEKYFNSGMLLLNLNKIRQNNAQEKMLNILKNDILACPDQDCFNICFHNSVKIVSMNYNFMVVNKDIHADLQDNDKTQYDTILKNSIPLIIHFLTKPWLGCINDIPYADLYYKYRDKTIYKYNPDKASLRNFIRLKISLKELYLYLFNKKIFSMKLRRK